MSRTARLVGTLTLVGMAIVSGSAQTQAAGPFQFNSLTPCRVFDTRCPNHTATCTSLTGTPLPNPGPHKFTIKGACGVPAGAKAVTLNATITQPNRAGDLRLFPADVASFPDVSTMNYNAGEAALANGAIVPLGATATDDLGVLIGMQGTGGTVHVIVDVTGYFQ